MVANTNIFTPENIAASELIETVKLSPDGKKALYHVKPAYKNQENETCAIWIADTDKDNSARPLTSGLFNDSAATFHPDCERIVFLSDRHKAGGPLQLYAININGGEAVPLIGKDNKKGVSKYVISPNGLHVAFTSADEPNDEQKKKEEEKDDAKEFGDKSNSERLRLYSFSTGTVRTLDTTPGRHVLGFTWKHDSGELQYFTTQNKALEFQEDIIPLERISIVKGAPEVLHVKSYPRAPSGEILWTRTGDVVEIQNYIPELVSDASSLYVSDRRLYGEKEDVHSVLDLKDDGYIAVEIASGINSRIDILQGRERRFSLYETKDEALSSWDVVRLSDGTYVLAAILSSSIRQEPLNVWIARSSKDETVKPCLKLSTHFQWVEEAPRLSTKIFEWKAGDGTELQGICMMPENSSKPLPAILLVHGGPYGRDVPNYLFQSSRWHQILASRGYLILSPNYRGSEGRGHVFAKAAHAGMGTSDWTDCESMLDEAIKLGLADPKRLGIGGWSQGGFMTAWGVTATKNRFRAGVMGAGVSDWGQMAAESDLPDFEADLGGSAPWTPGQRVDLEGSPIRYVKGVETAVLILHGEKDERVPVSQAISFMRGLRRESKYPERAQLVIYPREKHSFIERKHVEDILKRVIEHFETWL